MKIDLLDGAMGTELIRRGVAASTPAWSAVALRDAPDVVHGIHRDYAAAGATIHTANTFRTRRLSDWEHWTRRAVELTRSAVPASQWVAGSIAPLEDCYRPDLSPADPRPGHRKLARCLASCGVDLILCETFPHVGEGWIALEEAVATRVETWIAFTPGPFAPLLTPEEVRVAALGAIERGAARVLVNCVPLYAAEIYLDAVLSTGVPAGVYANAASPGVPTTPAEYAAEARRWQLRGASVIGGCCGVGPAHIAAVAQQL